jgi:hypothetical protein
MYVFSSQPPITVVDLTDCLNCDTYSLQFTSYFGIKYQLINQSINLFVITSSYKMSVMKRNCKCTNKKKMFPFLCVWLPVVLPTQIVCFRFIIYFFNIIRCFVNDDTLHVYTLKYYFFQSLPC